MYSPLSFLLALFLFLGQMQGSASIVVSRVENFERMDVTQQNDLKHRPSDTLSDTLTPSSTLIETISLSTSFSASIFVSDGLAEISSIPFTITYATLVPYVVPSPDAQSAAAQTPESANQTSKSSLPILPIAAGGGGLVLVILLSISYLLYRRRRQIAVRRSLQDEKRLPPPQPNLDTELPRRGPSRTFSRLTFSAPYVLPRSNGSSSTAAPSTISIGQQYRTAPSSRR